LLLRSGHRRYALGFLDRVYVTSFSYIAKTINVSSPSGSTAEGTEEFLELANGCLCCSIKDSGVAAIEKLMQKKGAFDYILLETTGLADPGVFSIRQTLSKRKLTFAFSRSNRFYVLAE